MDEKNKLEDSILTQFSEEEINKNIDLRNLVTVTAQNFIRERQTVIGELVRKVFIKKRELFEEILKLEKELNKKRESLKLTNERIEKIRQGDWEVLKRLENENK